MKLSEYQSAALSTAMEKAFSLDYLVPMIIGELGELSGQKAKAHWHGWPEEKLEVELVSEYGDVCWGTAILLHMADVSDLTYARFPTTTAFSAGSALQVLLQRAAYMHGWYVGVDPSMHIHITGEACVLWLELEALCEAVTGVPFETVLRANLEKLRSRAERGTLVGSGDHR